MQQPEGTNSFNPTFDSAALNAQIKHVTQDINVQQFSNTRVALSVSGMNTGILLSSAQRNLAVQHRT